MESMDELYVVRSFSAPLRRKTLIKLVEEVYKSYELSGLGELMKELRSENSQSVWSVKVPLTLLKQLKEILYNEIEHSYSYLKYLLEEAHLNATNDAFKLLLLYTLKHAPYEDLLVVDDFNELSKVPSSHDIFWILELTKSITGAEVGLNEVLKVLTLSAKLAESGEIASFELADSDDLDKAIALSMYVLYIHKARVKRLAELLHHLLPADPRPGLNAISLFSATLISSSIFKTLNVQKDEVVKLLVSSLSSLAPIPFLTINQSLLRADSYALDVAIGFSSFMEIYEKYEKELKELLGKELYEALIDSFRSEESGFELLKPEAVDRLRRASEFLARKLFTNEFELKGDRGVPRSYLISLSLRGIKSSLKTLIKLKSLCAAAYLFDIFNNVLLTNAISSVAGPEAIAFSGGGSVQAIIKENDLPKVLRKVREILNDAKEVMLTLDISIGIKWKSLEGGVREAFKEVFSREDFVEVLAPYDSKRLRRKEELFHFLRRCQLCGSRLGWIKEGNNLLCSKCFFSLKLSDLLGFGDEGIRSAITKLLGESPNYQEDLKEFLAKGTLISIVRGDGNLAGYFALTSPTLALYQERSFRVELALRRALREIFDSLSSEEKAKLVYGLLYAGADKFAAIMSPSLAFLSSIGFTYLFSSEFGFTLSSSAALTSTRKDSPTWEALEVVDEMLETINKDLKREEMEECMKLKRKCYGYVSFILSKGMVTRMFGLSKVSSFQPYSTLKLINLLRLSLGLRTVKDVSNIQEDEEIEKFITEIIKGEKREKLKNQLRWLRLAALLINDEPYTIRLFASTSSLYALFYELYEIIGATTIQKPFQNFKDLIDDLNAIYELLANE